MPLSLIASGRFSLHLRWLQELGAVHFFDIKAFRTGLRAWVLPLPQPSSLGARFPRVPIGDALLPECIAQLDDWAATLNDLDVGGSSCVCFGDPALPPSAAQLIRLGLRVRR